MTEKNIQVKGGTVHILEAGNPAGRAIILLHGMKFNAATWQQLKTLEHLAGAGHHVLAIDMPGFGKSPVSQESPVAILNGIIAAEKLEKAILIGPSMGGRTCLEFALDFPGQVGGLVLIGAVGVQENKDRLSGINLPCLVVWGGEDQISPLVNGRLLVSEIKDSRLVIIDGAPHPCYLDQPDTWHRELTGWLAERSSC